jgi:uncharacterized protein YdeI (YjbR/CyaY-like superfamily)
MKRGKEKLSSGTVHTISQELRDVLLLDSKMHEIWESLTPLARNEWICWITSAKKEETKAKRLAQAIENLKDGKRRPCCWPGCPHR